MRVLFVCARHPGSQSRGDQLRALQFVKGLSLRHEIVLLVPDERVREARGDGVVLPDALRAKVSIVCYRRRISDLLIGIVRSLVRNDSLQSALFRSTDLTRQLRRLAPSCDLAILQLVRLEGHLDDLGSLPVLVDLIDCLSLSFQARSRHDRWLAPLWRWESARLLKSERRVVERAAATCLVCERDREYLASQLEGAGAALARISVVPVAIEDRAPGVVTPSRPVGPESFATLGIEGRTATLILSGNLGYFPTRHGAKWFLRRVWPRLRARRPDLRLVLAGARPDRGLLALAAESKVEVVDSPADLESWIRSADIAIAPLFCGAGVPVKVLEAWRAGVPVVATEWAARGAGADSGVELLTAEDADSWLEAIERLLDDPALRSRLAGKGRARLHRHHTADVVRERLEGWLEHALASL